MESNYATILKGSKNLLCVHGWVGQTQLPYWRRISQSEIRNSAAAEKSDSESEGGQKFLPPHPLPFCPPERSVFCSAFGQSKYYSDNLSENVKRGIRQKLRWGEWPGLAPFGYVNNPKTRTIEPEPTKSRCVTKALEEFSQGRHTLESLGQRLSFWGVVSKTGKPICKATLQRMLTNKVYLGIIVHNGESYEGGFPAIVSRATFEAVQKVLKQRARPRKSKKRHNFPFVGLLTCGECGGAITAQFAHGNGGTYRYYRCTKKAGKCSQGYLRKVLLAEQLKERLQKVALCEDWSDKMLKRIDEWEKEKDQCSQTFAQNLDKEIKEME